MRTGDMQILLHRGMQVGTGEEERAGRAGETDVARCFAQDGLREAPGRLAHPRLPPWAFLPSDGSQRQIGPQLGVRLTTIPLLNTLEHPMMILEAHFHIVPPPSRSIPTSTTIPPFFT